MKKKFVIRLGVYSFVLLYLFLDLSCGGPLSRGINTKKESSQKVYNEIDAVVTVYGQPITRGQVLARMNERLWRQGRLLSQLSETEHDLLFKYCLEQLIDSHLVGIKAYHNRETVEVDEAQASQKVKNIESLFVNPQSYANALTDLGLSNDGFSTYKKRELEKEKYLENQIKTSELNSDKFGEVDKSGKLLKLQHLFYARSDHSKEEALVLLNESKARWTKGERDEAFTELGWVNLTRFPSGFSEALESLELNEPQIIESSYGYHLFLKTDERLISGENRNSNQNFQRFTQREKGFDHYLKHLRFRDADRVIYLQDFSRK